MYDVCIVLYCIVFVFVLYCIVLYLYLYLYYNVMYTLWILVVKTMVPQPNQSIEAKGRGPRAQPFRRGVVTVRCGPPSGGFFMVQFPGEIDQKTNGEIY